MDRLAQLMRKLAAVNVIKHHRGGEQQGEWISNSLSRKIRDRAMYRFEDRGVYADVGGRGHTQPTTGPAISSDRISPKRLVVTMSS
jgi:hypothetical protein